MTVEAYRALPDWMYPDKVRSKRKTNLQFDLVHMTGRIRVLLRTRWQASSCCCRKKWAKRRLRSAPALPACNVRSRPPDASQPSGCRKLLGHAGSLQTWTLPTLVACTCGCARRQRPSYVATLRVCPGHAAVPEDKDKALFWTMPVAVYKKLFACMVNQVCEHWARHDVPIASIVEGYRLAHAKAFAVLLR